MNINKEKFISAVKHPYTKVAVVSAVVGGVTGAAITYTACRNEIRRLDRIIEHEKRARFRAEHRVVIEESENTDKGYGYDEPYDEEEIVRTFTLPEPEDEEEPERTVEVVRRNVFAEAGADDNWDYGVEVKQRDSSEPYVLHKDEFYAEEMSEHGFRQFTYTYFDGDDILADEDDKPIYNHHNVVGDLKFGHGSGDPKVVYIRNEKRKEEYEVVKDPGLYSKEILGLEIEQNDRAKGPGKFQLEE